MECVETAKNWCLKQGKPAPQLSLPTVVIIDDGDNDDDDDSLSGRPLTCGSGDEDFVEQLLNFNNDNTEQDALGPDCVENTEEDGKKHGAFASPAPMVAKQHQGDFVKEDFGSILAPLPVDEPHLEWLSQFVEDSFSTPTPYPATSFISKTEHRPWAAKPGTTALVTTTKSKRTQRGRTSSTSWSFGSDSTTISSSSSTSSSHPNGLVLISSPMMLAKKKPRMMARAVLEGKARGTQVATPRRCSHCGVQKTPQWREGPGGAKSLCNACGVRFKKGRLLPEYRPACSPTFSSELHSNSHRKVMELRGKKEEMMRRGSGWTGGGEPGVARPVSGYL